MRTAPSLLNYLVVFSFVVASPAAGAVADPTAQPPVPDPGEQTDDSRELEDDDPFDALTLFYDQGLPLLRISPSLYFQLSERDKLRAQKYGLWNPDGDGGGGSNLPAPINPRVPIDPPAPNYPPPPDDPPAPSDPPGPDPPDPNVPRTIPEPAHLLLFAPAALLGVRRWKRRGHA